MEKRTRRRSLVADRASRCRMVLLKAGLGPRHCCSQGFVSLSVVQVVRMDVVPQHLVAGDGTG